MPDAPVEHGFWGTMEGPEAGHPMGSARQRLAIESFLRGNWDGFARWGGWIESFGTVRPPSVHAWEPTAQVLTADTCSGQGAPVALAGRGLFRIEANIVANAAADTVDIRVGRTVLLTIAKVDAVAVGLFCASPRLIHRLSRWRGTRICALTVLGT